MAAGQRHSLALDTLGNVWAWGNNDRGQIGSDLANGALDALVPVRNTPLFAQVNQHSSPPIRAIAAGSDHSLALDSAGVVWAWGSNDSGQLGLGSGESFITVASPILSLRGRTSIATTITAIAAGGDHSLALDSLGNVWAWGDNHNGQLGIGGSQGLSSVPLRVDFPTFGSPWPIARIAAGGVHSLAIDAFGNVWAWGAAGTTGLFSSSFVPTRVAFPAGTPRMVMIAGGGGHSLAVDANGNAWAWGFANTRGQLGNGTRTASGPARVIYPDGQAHPIVSIAAGKDHSLALESLPLKSI
jgi:alpha-tubulin suppressor-like RCC1 family protein